MVPHRGFQRTSPSDRLVCALSLAPSRAPPGRERERASGGDPTSTARRPARSERPAHSPFAATQPRPSRAAKPRSAGPERVKRWRRNHMPGTQRGSRGGEQLRSATPRTDPLVRGLARNGRGRCGERPHARNGRSRASGGRHVASGACRLEHTGHTSRGLPALDPSAWWIHRARPSRSSPDDVSASQRAETDESYASRPASTATE